MEDDDDFGDFEDASKHDVPQDNRDVADILKDVMGSPVMDKRASYFDDELAKATQAAAIDSTLPSSRSPYRPEKSPNLSRSDPPPKALPFKPKSPTHGRKQSGSSGLPFKPKPPPVTESKKPPTTGSHPFAGNMDLLFAAGDDDDYDAGADDLNVDLSNDPEAAMAYSKQLIAAQAAANEKAPPPPAAAEPKRQPNKLRKKSQYAPANNADVLFDFDDPANQEPELDDWGDFEGGPTSTPQSTAKVTPSRTNKSQIASNLDLLSLDDTPSQTAPHPSNGWHSSAQKQPKPTQKASQSQLPPTAPTTDDDAWDDFESAAPPTTQAAPSLPTSISNLASKLPTPSTSTLPPTNIPPPLLLLSIFPSLIAEAQTHLSLLPKPSNPSTQQFLHGYTTLATVLAHIIAGRKLRWKRDQFLAQGMRIGPAGGKGGGMKLTGIDRMEAAKEDREVLDLVRLWRGQAGKLRSAVTGAHAGGKVPAVPEIAEQMPVKMLRAAEGGFTASHACALCGLKREERVARVDEGVEDSFGEWWVERMNMHLVCRNFWEEYKDRLKSR